MRDDGSVMKIPKYYLWTVEEEAELAELVEEQQMVFERDPALAWWRIAVQLDKTPEQCERHWEWMGIRKGNPKVTPFYTGWAGLFTD